MNSWNSSDVLILQPHQVNEIWHKYWCMAIVNPAKMLCSNIILLCGQRHISFCKMFVCSKVTNWLITNFHNFVDSWKVVTTLKNGHISATIYVINLQCSLEYWECNSHLIKLSKYICLKKNDFSFFKNFYKFVLVSKMLNTGNLQKLWKISIFRVFIHFWLA